MRDLARIDRKRKKKGSNDDWTHPDDPDAKITKKDNRNHLAHKAEHAVDLETGAVVAVTVQDADEGDTATSVETLIEAAEQVETVLPDGEGITEVVADKGYHSNQELVDLEAVGLRSYISEPDRGRRNWKDNPEARDAVYRNRARGAAGTAVCASLRNRTHATRASARSPQHSQTCAAACRRLESGPFDADARWRGHAAEPPRTRRCVRVPPLVVHSTPRDMWGRDLGFYRPFSMPDDFDARREDRQIDCSFATTCATGC